MASILPELQFGCCLPLLLLHLVVLNKSLYLHKTGLRQLTPKTGSLCKPFPGLHIVLAHTLTNKVKRAGLALRTGDVMLCCFGELFRPLGVVLQNQVPD